MPKKSPSDRISTTHPTASLRSLVYVSSATRLLDPNELDALLDAARACNRRVGVTGLLLFCEGNFMQVLEGPEPAVAEVFRAIGRDRRHHDLTRLACEPIGRREFEGWDMAYNTATASEFLALTRADWRPAARAPCCGRRMLRTFWAACCGRRCATQKRRFADPRGNPGSAP